MISKERLEELIEQRATIYEAKYHKINSVDLSKRKLDFISSKYNMVRFEPMPNEKWLHHKYLDKLFETEEDARWELEMTATRMETLKLPTWEEFEKNKRFIFTSADHTWYEISIFKKKIFWSFAADEYWDDYEDWKPVEATKENYIKACKLCLKLFKGEEV